MKENKENKIIRNLIFFVAIVVLLMGYLKATEVIAKAEAFPYCRFPSSQSYILSSPNGDVELNHPEGKAVKAYSLRNHPDVADGTGLGAFLHLQYCHMEAVMDWLAAWTKEAEGRLKLHRVITMQVYPSVIDFPNYSDYVSWREKTPRLPLINEWSQALDVAVFFSPIYDPSQWVYIHDPAIISMCLDLRVKRQKIYDMYNYVSKSLEYELKTHYNDFFLIPDIPYSTWDGSNWDTDNILREDKIICQYVP